MDAGVSLTGKDNNGIFDVPFSDDLIAFEKDIEVIHCEVSP
jgi:hypothetical protein